MVAPTLKWNIFQNRFHNTLCTKNIFCDIYYANIVQYVLKKIYFVVYIMNYIFKYISNNTFYRLYLLLYFKI